jgi:DHA1 family bicyclomycin/chloramphenicol resistance-like MFS transporter
LFGTFVGGRLVTKLGLNRMIKWGVLFGVLGGGLMLLLALLELRTPYAIILPMWVFIFGLAFVNPNSVASALQPFPGIAGSASSITNFIRGIFGAAVSFGISFFNHDDALVLATTIFILCCLATLSICTKTYKQ